MRNLNNFNLFFYLRNFLFSINEDKINLNIDDDLQIILYSIETIICLLLINYY